MRIDVYHHAPPEWDGFSPSLQALTAAVNALREEVASQKIDRERLTRLTGRLEAGAEELEETPRA